MIQTAAIKVALKVRPSPSPRVLAGVQELPDGAYSVKITLPSEETQVVSVDYLHDANKQSCAIHESVKLEQFVKYFQEGYNVAVIAYGQTGSGKTYAMEDQSGIIPQAIQLIYGKKTSENALVKCTYIQIYNEKITDMFNPSCDSPLKMRWEVEREFVIDDLTEKICPTAEAMLKEWTVGRRNRVVAANKIHDYSSRSHSIFAVTIEDEDQQGNFRTRQCMFVDLAGSQRIMSPVGRLTKQSIQINKSLFFLRKVIMTLEEGKEKYIPYRDSKLTSLLKNALGGNCLTLIIACVDGREDALEETLSTIQYAVSACKISNQVHINIDPKARLIKGLQLQNCNLKRELECAIKQIELLKNLHRAVESKQKSNSEYANRIVQCVATVRDLLKGNKQARQELELEKTWHQQTKREHAELQIEFQAYRKKQRDTNEPPKAANCNQSVPLSIWKGKGKSANKAFRRTKFLLRDRLLTEGGRLLTEGGRLITEGGQAK